MVELAARPTREFGQSRVAPHLAAPSQQVLVGAEDCRRLLASLLSECRDQLIDMSPSLRRQQLRIVRKNAFPIIVVRRLYELGERPHIPSRLQCCRPTLALTRHVSPPEH